MRQFGVGSQGGAEGLALVYDECASGSLNTPLARIKVDEKHRIGMIEWKAVRKAASHFSPQHTAAAGWKHRNLSHVEQEELSLMRKDRGAEQADVDGPLECSLALGMVAAQQASSNLPWIGVDDPSETQRLQAEHTAKMQRASNFQLGGHENWS